MGEIARTVAAGLGPESVIGVIPSHLQSREVSVNSKYAFFSPRQLKKGRPYCRTFVDSVWPHHPILSLMHDLRKLFPGKWP